MKIFALLIAAVILQGCTITGEVTRGIPSEEHFNRSIAFCDKYDCLNRLLRLINSSETDVKCALYSADKSVIDAIELKNRSVSASLITNKDRKKAGLMHNKFCVFDKSIVWTGSFNPVRQNSRDDIIVINSTLLAKNYLDEFEELKGNNNRKTFDTRIILNTTLVENYFCPEDNCIDALQGKLAAAESSIYFATYSFTHPKIANELIIKNSTGVIVKGIMEKGGSYSQFQTLKSNGLAVSEDASKSLLHHKFFIIDESVVITGSFNPTRNGDERNDENMLIISDKGVASAYLEYYKTL